MQARGLVGRGRGRRYLDRRNRDLGSMAKVVPVGDEFVVTADKVVAVTAMAAGRRRAHFGRGHVCFVLGRFWGYGG